jgi:hypothetical protein
MEKMYLVLGWISLVSFELIRVVYLSMEFSAPVSLWLFFAIGIILVLLSSFISLIKWAELKELEKAKKATAKDITNLIGNILGKKETSEDIVH